MTAAIKTNNFVDHFYFEDFNNTIWNKQKQFLNNYYNKVIFTVSL